MSLPVSSKFSTSWEEGEVFGPDQYAEVEIKQLPDPTWLQEIKEIAARENLVAPLDFVQENDRLVLLATKDRIVYEASSWPHGESCAFFTFHPSHAARCRRVYSRLEPYGA